MFKLSITGFLKSPNTELTSVYGHLVSIFQFKNNLAIGQLIHCSFSNALEHKKLSFRFNIYTNEIIDVSFTDMEHNPLGELCEEDRLLIVEVLPIYFNRVEQLVAKITKEMRQDWGREFKSEAIERSGFTYYMSRTAQEIEKSCKLSIFPYTLSNIDKKRATAFQGR